MNKIKELKLNKGNAWVGILIMLVIITALGLSLIAEVLGTIIASKKSAQVITAQALCDAGVEKAVWKLNHDTSGYTGEDDINLETGIIDIEVTSIDTETKSVLVTSYVPDKTDSKVTRKVRAKVKADINESNISFHYGVQVGGLGVTMSNNSKIFGNVYSDGPIIGGGGSKITGDAISSGPTGSIRGSGNSQRITIGNDARANTLQYLNITRDAYYNNISSSTVTGISYPGSTNPTPVGLPIDQNTIDTWESWAQTGSTYNGNYTLDGNNSTLGPIKINGNLTVINGSVLTMTGVIWVTGNISFANNAVIKLDPSFGQNSGMIITDSPTDKATYGKVEVSNNVRVCGSYTLDQCLDDDPPENNKSYIMILSTNTGSTTSNPAIDAGNNSKAVVYYTTVGMLEVANNGRLRAVTGGGLHLSNGAEVQYDIGLADANFSGGPGGSWVLTEWQIVH